MTQFQPTRLRRLGATSTALLLGWAVLGLAQTPAKPKDADLADLLKKVDEAAKPKDVPKTGKPKAGDLAPKDKDLDDLLGSMKSKDAPATDGKPPEPPPGSAGQKPPTPEGGKGDQDKDKDKQKDQKSTKPKSDDLTGQDKDLDEHLSGAAKKKQQQQRQQGQGKGQKEEDGPLGDLIKQMREVEERLGQPDTGEQTRQKQTQIVKRLDGLIEQAKMMKTQRQVMRSLRAGNQPGQQQGQQPGAQANGVPPSKPLDPAKPKPSTLLGKEPWGHLPPALRDEMNNVFKEEMLPSKKDLIDRYYLSVSQKKLTRGE
jgi:hypothetical protein